MHTLCFPKVSFSFVNLVDKPESWNKNEQTEVSSGK